MHAWFSEGVVRVHGFTVVFDCVLWAWGLGEEFRTWVRESGFRAIHVLTGQEHDRGRRISSAACRLTKLVC